MNRTIDRYAAACAVVDFENFLKLHKDEKWFQEVYNEVCKLEMKIMDLPTIPDNKAEFSRTYLGKWVFKGEAYEG